MSSIQNVQNIPVNKIKVSEKVTPPWLLVLRRELVDLWIGGKAFTLMLIYSLLLSGMVYVYSFNTELSLIPPKEATYEMLKNAMAVAIFVSLIIGADAFSGERGRATLESLLLTPASRRQVILGKFLAAFSIWPAAFLIAIPYLYVLAQGDAVLGPALFWGVVTGTILVIGHTALGMLVSFWSGTNKVSYFIALGIYAALLRPAELPGNSTGPAGQFLQWINPMAAINHFLSKHLVNYRSLAEFWPWLVTAIVLAVAATSVLFIVGAGLRLETGQKSKFWGKVGRAFGMSVFASFMTVSLLIALPARAFQADQKVSISIDTGTRQVKTGDSVEFNTIVTNHTADGSPPFIVAMNVINLDARGDVVDPEDWSPQRTQYVDSLMPGQSVSQPWIINTILEGNYMVYMVVIPEPGNAEATSQPVASSGIHLTVSPFTRLNPGGVLPIAIGVPAILLVVSYLVYRRRHQQIDMGGF